MKRWPLWAFWFVPRTRPSRYYNQQRWSTTTHPQHDLISRNAQQQDLPSSLWGNAKEGEEDCFATVQILMEQAVRAGLEGTKVVPPFNLQSAGSSDGQTDNTAIPEIFRFFYAGELPDFVEQPTETMASQRKRKTHSYRLDLAYDGTQFCGWQTQDKQGTKKLSLPAVQDLVQAAVDNRDVRVAGRTDAGVHAVSQVARVRCDTNMTKQALERQLQKEAARHGGWSCRRVMPVSHKFHPAFGASSRSYVYLLDVQESKLELLYGSVDKLTSRLNALLAPLVGVSLPYIALSYGRPSTQTCNCTLHHAYARVLQFNNQPVLSIELTGDRFLRRMVRILVSTALSLAAARSDTEFDEHALLRIVESKQRRNAALPAPSRGLVFVAACYDFSQTDF